MKLTLKLTVALIVAVTLVLTGYAVTRVQRQLELFETDMSSDHRAFARALANASEEVSRRYGDDAALALIEDANVRESGIDIRWLDERYTEASSRVEVGVDERYLVTKVPVVLPSGTGGAIRLRESMAHEDEYIAITVQRAVMQIATTILVCSVLILVLGVALVGRPMARLMDKARRVGSGDLEGPLDLRQRDEIGSLAIEMNAMCDRLSAAQARVRAETDARISALEQLRHADRLATIGKLASGLAHELGTPLNVVLARARMIERGESEGPRVLTDARIIAEQTVRMTAIIRQLLDFARRRSMRKQPEDLAAIARHTLALIEPIATKRGIDLGEPADEGRIAEVDVAQIEQVLTNLVMNAVQAQPKGGAVRISIDTRRRAPPPDVGAEERDWLCVCVADDGPGMPADVADHVFEPFFTTKDVGEGTGLGLSVAWGIVREHGGFIDVWTEPGKGSKFTVWLPVGT
jgi:signal transduction histidine kinase